MPPLKRVCVHILMAMQDTGLIQQVISYSENVQGRRVVSAVKPGYLAPLLPSSAPEESEPWAEIQKDIEAKIQPGMTHWCVSIVHADRPSAKHIF